MAGSYSMIDGDLISLALSGEFDVISHGCNCMSKMGAGIAVAMARTFGCDRFDYELAGPNILKLGNIDFKRFTVFADGKVAPASYSTVGDGRELTVVNSYTQVNYGRNHSDGGVAPLDYNALHLCMKKINVIFAGKHVGLPMIGAGLAGGDWPTINSIIRLELKDCDVTVVKFTNKK